MSAAILMSTLIACDGAPRTSADGERRGTPPGSERQTPRKNTAPPVDPMLQPYIEALKQDLGRDELDRIAACSEDELILHHHGLGTAIRNRWLWGSRDAALIAFFQARGIHHPDDMSMEIVRALWAGLQNDLTEQERQHATIERDLRQRKRRNYDRLSRECAENLTRDAAGLESCFARFGPASANPVSRVPFYRLIVSAGGTVKRIEPFEGGNEETKRCLAAIVSQHRFSSFDLEPELTLFVTQFPSCLVQEIDDLHP